MLFSTPCSNTTFKRRALRLLTCRVAASPATLGLTALQAPVAMAPGGSPWSSCSLRSKSRDSTESTYEDLRVPLYALCGCRWVVLDIPYLGRKRSFTFRARQHVAI